MCAVLVCCARPCSEQADEQVHKADRRHETRARRAEQHDGADCATAGASATADVEAVRHGSLSSRCSRSDRRANVRLRSAESKARELERLDNELKFRQQQALDLQRRLDMTVRLSEKFDVRAHVACAQASKRKRH